MPDSLVPTEILFRSEIIQARVTELGAQISLDYAGDPPLLLCILKGAVVFFADLVRAITLDCEWDFIQAASYGGNVTSSGSVHLLKDAATDVDLRNRRLLLVEDILDTGITLSFLVEHLTQRGAKDIRIAALLDKPSRRQAAITADYVGFAIPDRFVVGYGLDHAQKFRNLHDICALANPSKQ